VSRFFADCKKISHLAQELVLDTNKISTPFSPNPSLQIKKGEIEENASYYLLSAKKSYLLCKLQERFSLHNEHVLVAPNNFPPFPPNPVSSWAQGGVPFLYLDFFLYANAVSYEFVCFFYHYFFWLVTYKFVVLNSYS
jgi:hypothetical protein